MFDDLDVYILYHVGKWLLYALNCLMYKLRGNSFCVLSVVTPVYQLYCPDVDDEFAFVSGLKNTFQPHLPAMHCHHIKAPYQPVFIPLS